MRVVDRRGRVGTGNCNALDMFEQLIRFYRVGNDACQTSKLRARVRKSMRRMRASERVCVRTTHRFPEAFERGAS